MPPQIIFQTQLLLGYFAWLLCFRAYVWPRRPYTPNGNSEGCNNTKTQCGNVFHTGPRGDGRKAADRDIVAPVPASLRSPRCRDALTSS